MSKPPQILLIDDDRKLTRLLTDLFHSQGFKVHAVHDGAEGIRRAEAGGWNLILLDLMLPVVDGLSVLKHLRTISDVPVLMLTGRGGEEDRIAGLEKGADDYVPKAVSARELLARVRTILRRAEAGPARAPSQIHLGPLQINLAAREVRMAGTAIELTPAEFDILVALARKAGEVCSREQLLSEVRDREFTGAERSIDMHIAALRRKLGDDPREPTVIRTVRASGYLLVSPVDP